MVRLGILLYILSISVVYAKGEIYFLDKPDYITATDAMVAIGHAAKNKKYFVPGEISDTLRVTLDHKGYSVDLVFSVSENKIVYKDLTTYGWYDNEDSASGGSAKPVPESWLNSLKNNTKILFPLIKKIKNNMASH